MKYETIQTLKDEDFKRSMGVSCTMFEKMVVGLPRTIGSPALLVLRKIRHTTSKYFLRYETDKWMK
jgi:hypothetical protein